MKGLAVNTFLIVLIAALVLGNLLLSAAKPKKRQDWLARRAAHTEPASENGAHGHEPHFNEVAALESQFDGIAMRQSQIEERVGSIEREMRTLKTPESVVAQNPVAQERTSINADESEAELMRKINQLVYHSGEPG